jgi:YggT family protein
VTAAILQTFGYSITALLVGIVDYAYYILLGFIIAWVLISWFPGYPSSRFLQVVYDSVGNVVNPIMYPIRSRIPPLRLGGFALDLSPIIALLALWIGRRLLTTIILVFIQPVVG